MIEIGFNTGLTELSVTLGAVDTNSPPAPLLFRATRKGTNTVVEQFFIADQIVGGGSATVLTDFDTDLYLEGGQWQYEIIHNDGSGDTILTFGLLIVNKDFTEPKSYGTDRERKEHYRA